jgi:hypothetical protein
MPTPARSARDDWASRLNLVTKPRSSTTPTGSSSITPSRSETPQMHRNWRQRLNGSAALPDARHARSPQIAATARRRSNAHYMSSAWQAWPFPAQANPAPPAASLNTGAPSATRSNGEPDPKDASTTSNEPTAGTEPNSPASRVPEPGADTAYSPTPGQDQRPRSMKPTHTPASHTRPKLPSQTQPTAPTISGLSS